MFSRRAWTRQVAGFFRELTSSPRIINQHGRMWMSSCETTGESRRYVALWGNGDYGRLGHGSLDSQWTPKFISPPAFCDLSIHSVACGGAHTLFLTETGRVFACGLNKHGQIGVSTAVSYSVEPLEVHGFDEEIVHISAGYHHSCAVSASGEIYVWGKNSSGQLGLGKNANKVFSLPTKLSSLSGVKIIMAALGSEHTIAVSGNGETFSWGEGRSGQLGHGKEFKFYGIFRSTSEYTPRLIKTLEGIKVKCVSAGMLHSACVDENGFPFFFGEVAGGNLVGRKDESDDLTNLHDIRNSTMIACGGYHTSVITRGGELYSFGINENGCLGIGFTSSIHFPERVEGPLQGFHVEKVSCGWKHTAAICGGNMFSWGWGGSYGTFSDDGLSSGGQLGLGNDFDYFYPTLVEFDKTFKVLEVSCGFNHTAAILQSRET